MASIIDEFRKSMSPLTDFNVEEVGTGAIPPMLGKEKQGPPPLPANRITQPTTTGLTVAQEVATTPEQTAPPATTAAAEEVVPEIRKAQQVTHSTSQLDTLKTQLADFNRKSDEHIIRELSRTPPKYQAQYAQLLKMQQEQARMQLTSRIDSLGGEIYQKLPVEAQYSADKIREQYGLDGVQAARLAADDHAIRTAITPVLAQFGDATPEEYGKVYNRLFGVTRENPDGTQIRVGGLITQNRFGTLEVSNQGALDKYLEDFAQTKKIAEAKTYRDELGVGSGSKKDPMDLAVKQYEDDAQALKSNADATLKNPNATQAQKDEANLYLMQADKLQKQAIKARAEQRTGEPTTDVTADVRKERLQSILPELEEIQKLQISDRALSKKETTDLNLKVQNLAEKVGVTEFIPIKDDNEMQKFLDKVPENTMLGFEKNGIKFLKNSPEIETQVKALVDKGAATMKDGLLVAAPSAPPRIMADIATLNNILRRKRGDYNN